MGRLVDLEAAGEFEPEGEIGGYPQPRLRIHRLRRSGADGARTGLGGGYAEVEECVCIGTCVVR